MCKIFSCEEEEEEEEEEYLPEYFSLWFLNR